MCTFRQDRVWIIVAQGVEKLSLVIHSLCFIRNAWKLWLVGTFWDIIVVPYICSFFLVKMNSYSLSLSTKFEPSPSPLSSVTSYMDGPKGKIQYMSERVQKQKTTTIISQYDFFFLLFHDKIQRTSSHIKVVFCEIWRKRKQ